MCFAVFLYRRCASLTRSVVLEYCILLKQGQNKLSSYMLLSFRHWVDLNSGLLYIKTSGWSLDIKLGASITQPAPAGYSDYFCNHFYNFFITITPVFLPAAAGAKYYIRFASLQFFGLFLYTTGESAGPFTHLYIRIPVRCTLVPYCIYSSWVCNLA